LGALLRGGRFIFCALGVSTPAALAAQDGAPCLMFAMVAAIRFVLHSTAAGRIAARTKFVRLRLRHARVATRASRAVIVSAVGQLVAPAHHELKPVTLAAFAAAHEHPGRIAYDFEMTRARLTTPCAIGIEDMPVLGGNALHDRASARLVPHRPAAVGNGVPRITNSVRSG